MHRTYANDDVTIFWDSEKCRHAGKCVAGCPEVFDFTRKPWIDLQKAENAEIWNTVKQCPSGALDIIYNHGIRIAFDEAGCRSLAFDGKRQIGECDYQATDEGFRIYHTEVLPDYGGKGIAKRLVYRVVEEAERRGRAVIPLCSYAAKLLN